MTAQHTFRNLVFAVSLINLGALTSHAQDEDAPQIDVPEIRVEDTLLNDLMPEKKARLGLVIEELAPQLASHLNVNQGVYVASVDVDGPADKAGVVSGDVIVMVGEDPVKTISDLMVAVAESDGAKMVLTLDGPKGRRTAEVTPIMIAEKPVRPMTFDDLEEGVDKPSLPRKITGDVIQQLMNQFGQQLNGRTLDDLSGLADQLLGQDQAKATPLPKKMRIEIRRQNDKANVTVEVDGETYETDSENLDVLPDSVRSRVEALLRGRSGAHFDFGGLKIDLNQPPFRVRPRQLDPPSLGPKPFRPRSKDKDLPDSAGSYGNEDLRSEIEQLREELRQLREELKPKPTDLREFD